MVIFPNVKVNVGLNVLRKRSDGYHDLDTLFVPYFGIHDTLEINVAEKFSIDIVKDGGIDWDPMKDLTVKAYELMKADFDLPPVSIRLVKTSPVGAGLGGGSSDAAFTIKALNDLFELGLSDEELAGYAARLGSDCAFFIYNRPMMGSGRGEILEDYPLEGIDYGQPGGEALPYKLEVVVPEGVAVSTADAYRGIVPSIPEAPLCEQLAKPVEQWNGLVKNDFETTVFEKFPRIAYVKQSLYDVGAVYASMSGSGSSVYGIFRK